MEGHGSAGSNCYCTFCFVHADDLQDATLGLAVSHDRRTKVPDDSFALLRNVLFLLTF